MAVVVGSFDELAARQPSRAHVTAPASGSRLLTSAYRTREHRETACRSFP